MTPLILSALALIFLYWVYFAASGTRLSGPAAGFLDADQSLPGWAVMFLLPGLVLAGIGVDRHLGLVAHYGLQAGHIGIGVIPIAIAALLIWNRMWYVTRIAGLATPGEALGRYFDSVALRIVVLGLCLLFALPFAANILSFAAVLLEDATSGLVPRLAGVWLIAVASAFAAIIGGWRGTILTLAMLSVLILLFVPAVSALVEVTADTPGFPAAAIPQIDGILWDRLPGVLQNVFGIGKSVPAGGIFTAVGVASNLLALVGLVISPTALYLAQTSKGGRTLGPSAVWLTGGLLGGILILGAPVLAFRMMSGPMELARTIYAIEPLIAVMLLLAALAASILAVNLFVVGSTLLIVRDGVLRFLLPKLDGRQQRLTARITLGFAFFFMAFMAGFLPVFSAVLSSVVLPLTVQLLPAIAGLTFLRWISRGAVLAGLVLGMLIVVFTEPLGLILFEGLFVDLPWGRWPLTIHSAAWGLAFNLLLVLLASGATLGKPERFERERLHKSINEATGGASRGRGAMGGFFIIWSFLAYGPGAVLGNTFFSDPIFTDLVPVLNVPSLWVWQTLFWLTGVPLIWLLANLAGFGRLSDERIKPIILGAPPGTKPPNWLASSLRRLT